MTRVEYDICDIQAMLYERVARRGYELEEFSRRYLASRFCNRQMDGYSRFQLADDTMIFEYTEPEIGALPKRGDGLMFNPDAAGWIGSPTGSWRLSPGGTART